MQLLISTCTDGSLFPCFKGDYFDVPDNDELNSRAFEACNKLSEINGALGIYGWSGMGGIGKTTLAKVVYNHLVGRFSASRSHAYCTFEQTHGQGDKTNMSDQLKSILVQLGVKSECDFPDKDRYTKLLADRINGKIVLLLFDNVISRAQVSTLLKFSKGAHKESRIMFTTRNSDALLPEISRVDVKLLPTEAGRKLLQEKAGLSESDLKGELNASFEAVVKACDGLPLALELAGLYMRGKDLEKWKVSEHH